METHKIGNWEINNNGIQWIGKNEYFISKESLFDQMPGHPRLFDWHLHLALKTWITPKNMNDFNQAFLYAVNAYNLVLPADMSLEETLEEQQAIMKMKEEE